MTETTSDRSSLVEAAPDSVDTGAPPVRRAISREVLDDIFVEATIELARIRLPLHRVLDLVPGAVLELEKPIDSPLELRVDGRLFSHGDVVAVGDQFGLRIIAEPI